MALPIFDGKNGQDVNEWIAVFDRHFEAKETPENEKLPIAIAHLSPNVRACVENVGTCLKIIKGEKWIWTWSRLKLALILIQTQIREVQRAKRNAILKGVGIVCGGVAVGVAVPFAFLGVIGAMGFGAGGVAAGNQANMNNLTTSVNSLSPIGSMAAAIQSSIGAVEAGSLFAFCQSAAAGGAALTALGTAGAATGATVMVAGSATGAEEWLRIKKEKPSGSWDDGENFRPSPRVIIALIDAPL